jgi:N-acyl-L-homoserine lactone synthetase
MIEAFSLRSAHLFGDALASQSRLRFKVFVEQRGLNHRFYDDMEYDEFDTPGAVYFVWRDDDDIVRGLLRLLPTTIPYMLKTYWPDIVTSGELPASPTVREVTRLCVDKTFDSRVRMRIFPELLCALHEYCTAHAINHVVGVTREHLIAHFIREGIEWLGSSAMVEGELERAFKVALPYMRPAHHCERLGIRDRVLTLEPKQRQRIAA